MTETMGSGDYVVAVILVPYCITCTLMSPCDWLISLTTSLCDRRATL
jgi:hypothetical protein